MYAVIGAGPMGLATARNLKQQGLDYVGFELHSDVGGLWDIDNPHSTMYESAHLISSKYTTEFEEFPMRAEVADYPHHAPMGAYFRDYARHFGLYEDFEFETEVIDCQRRDGGGWEVTTEHGGERRTRHFDGVLIANGTLHHPNRPELPGKFAGRIMHSSEYRSPEIFNDQRVLIVGCGNSGADIAVDAAHRARAVGLSLRRGYYFVPKYIAGRPTDTLGGKLKLPRRLKQRVDAALIRLVIGKPSDYGLPDPDYRMYESHPVMNSQVLYHLGHGDITPHGDVSRLDGHTVHFADGSQAEYDLILLATGYKLHYPFIDRRHLNWPESAGAPQLYLNCFHPDYDDLFMMGMVEAAGLGWEGRNLQARLVALYLRGLAGSDPAALKLQATKAQHADERLDGGFDYLELERMAYYVHKETYRKAVEDAIAALASA